MPQMAKKDYSLKSSEKAWMSNDCWEINKHDKVKELHKSPQADVQNQ